MLSKFKTPLQVKVIRGRKVFFGNPKRSHVLTAFAELYKMLPSHTTGSKKLNEKVLGAICSTIKGFGFEIWLSMHNISKRTKIIDRETGEILEDSVSTRTVKRTIDALLEMGVLKKVKGWTVRKNVSEIGEVSFDARKATEYKISSYTLFALLGIYVSSLTKDAWDKMGLSDEDLVNAMDKVFELVARTLHPKKRRPKNEPKPIDPVQAFIQRTLQNAS